MKSLARIRALGWRIAVTLLILILLLLYSAWQRARPAAAQGSADPLVLAFYYPWYDQATWSSGQTSDTPAQPYASSDRSAMGRQIEQAQAAGIDAFVVAWYGPGGGNPTEGNLVALLEEAAARGFRIAILLETDSPFLGGSSAVTGALQHALSVHAASPAFLRVDGKPVLFMWRTNLFDVGTWQAIRSQADPGASSIWIADGTDTSYLSVFDGHHLYSNTWNPPADLGSVNGKFAAQVAGYRERSGAVRFWVATAMPGYDDTRARGGFAKDREGGAYYDRSWAAAIDSHPNWVVITSFNEWMEGSQIEPSATYGEQYLNQSARWSADFKAGGGAPASTGPLPAAAPVNAKAAETQAPEAVETAAGDPSPRLTVETALLNIRGGPGPNFPLVGAAPQGARLAITGADAAAPGWWQVEYGGVTGWVSGEWVTTAGDLGALATNADSETTTVAEPATSDAPAESMRTTIAVDAEPISVTLPVNTPMPRTFGWGARLSPRP